MGDQTGRVGKTKKVDWSRHSIRIYVSACGTVIDEGWHYDKFLGELGLVAVATARSMLLCLNRGMRVFQLLALPPTLPPPDDMGNEKSLVLRAG